MEIVRTHHEVGLTYAQLRAIWDQLPSRIRTTEVGEDAAAALAGNDSSDNTLEDAQRRRSVDRLQTVLRAGFEQLPAQDRVVVALRFDQDLSIAEIAKLTGSSAATLHRRLDRSVKHLRMTLTNSGLDPREIVQLIGHPSIALSPLLRTEVERFLGSVRLFKRDG
jgi:DNA-directed RNA polymerase specialized sigma24 family protein